MPIGFAAPFLRAFAAGLAGLALLSLPAWGASNSSAVAGPPGKSYLSASFRAPDGVKGAREVRLPMVDGNAIVAMQKANASSWSKRLDIGIGREVEDTAAHSANASWERVAGGHVARWAVVSPQAAALRIELDIARLPEGVEVRFSGEGDGATIYGPFAPSDLLNGESSYWSPVLTGERAFVELFVPAPLGPRDVDIGIRRLSHLFVHPADGNAVSLAKGGESGSCNVDIICRSAGDAALAAVAKSVARMTFTTSSGGSSLCTGTLLNPTGTQIPYFYSAAHCISTQSSASTLATHWFYDRAQCGSGTTPLLSAVPQVVGGAALLFANTSSDALLLRLNNSPPAGAVYAAWDSAALAGAVSLTAVHHPRGDWKKVSLGNFGNFTTFSGASYIRVDWTSAVTEPGSSGSGIFSFSGGEYRLRGGLQGGPSGCLVSASSMYDFYSRFDQAYPQISQYLSPAPAVTYALTVAKTGTGAGTVSSSPTGISCGSTCSASFSSGTSVTLTASASSGSSFGGWSGGGCSGTGNCVVTMDAAKTVTATFTATTPPSLEVSVTSLDFGGQLVRTTSPAKTVTLRNAGGGAITFSGFVASTGFGQTSTACTGVSLGGGASCAVRVTFSPTAEGSASGTLTITSSVGSRTVTLAGRGQASLVSHYYQSILRRAADSGGSTFWNDEAVRVAGLGANVNETWFTMAQLFFTSPEYLAFGRSNEAFVTDLYNTFFNRTPDGPGLSYWAGQLSQGLPREIAFASFMFSAEFASFTGALYGNTAARAEVDTVMDFYRGLLSRLPDNGGFGHWVQQFRTAQCQGSAAVTLVVDQISRAFLDSGEYAGRARTNVQFVGDLYNAFLRRGGDLAGVLFWINQLDTRAQTREQLRQAFLASAEFQARVAAVIAQGCTS